MIPLESGALHILHRYLWYMKYKITMEAMNLWDHTTEKTMWTSMLDECIDTLDNTGGGACDPIDRCLLWSVVSCMAFATNHSPSVPLPEWTQPTKVLADFRQKQTAAVVAFATEAHDQWRANFEAVNGHNAQRIKSNSDGTTGNINVPFDQLHPDWQRENLAAGRAALLAVLRHPGDWEEAAKYVHNEWMKRNPKADYNAAQHVPYEALSEPEKEKDRVHVRAMQRLLTPTTNR